VGVIEGGEEQERSGFFLHMRLRPIVGQPGNSSIISRVTDRPPFSLVREQDSTMWDIVWVSPLEHRSVSFYRLCNALDWCGNGSRETTVDVVG